jgi:ketosteroid isomerase-like protein
VATANAELVLEAFDSFNRDGPECLTRFFHPDAVSYPFPEWPDQSKYPGKAGIVELAKQWTALFDGYRWDIQHLLETDDTVVVLAVHSGRARGSGLETSSQVSAVFAEFRDGLVARVHYFISWREALELAGLDADAIPDHDD